MSYDPAARQARNSADFVVVDLLDRIEVDEVPDGYRETRLGLLPEEWQVVPLGDLFDIKQGKAVSAKKQTANGER